MAERARADGMERLVGDYVRARTAADADLRRVTADPTELREQTAAELATARRGIREISWCPDQPPLETVDRTRLR